MQAFEYASPKTREEAVKLLGSTWGETEVLAGGTDLISLMKDFVSTPKRVVSLTGVAGLGGVEFSSGKGLRIGAMATIEDLMDHPAVRQNYPGIVQAAEGISSQQIRAIGTVGGELCQRPRCWYYRGGYGLLATDHGKPLVPSGDNRYHAILGNAGPAYFVSPSSLAPILIALGAKVKLFGPEGERELDVEKFFVMPASDQEREHALKPNEIVTEINVPHHARAKMATYEVRQKEALDWPLAAAAVVLHMEGSNVSGARVVLGHVAPVPWPSPEAEQELAGKPPSMSVAASAGAAAVSKATPLGGNKYKVQLAKVAVKRAILQAAEA
ncbi:MAG TPA: FAD binding domain-containing protein [Terriglobia bacterium]|nr:FAD binding domain-containing protein [Terriglobia bacterium]